MSHRTNCSMAVGAGSADPLVGRTVAQYEIVARIGGGGMGVVYQAKDTRLGRFVALKFLPPQWSNDESARQRFVREAQAASATDHRNICTIHNIESTDDGQLFIVMAYYEGQTLKQKLEAGALRVDEALDIAAQLAEGLAKAHARGVVHRDIKPGNVLITEDGAKILDFGLAKFADSLQLTVAGSTFGTVAYMSPEQARGEEADARSDIWALGVVLYEMLTGSRPFRGTYSDAISYAIRTEPVPSLRAAGREIPGELEWIVAKALRKDPNARFQSDRDLARELRRLQGTTPGDLRTETLPRRWPALRRARSGFQTLGGVRLPPSHEASADRRSLYVGGQPDFASCETGCRVGQRPSNSLGPLWVALLITIIVSCLWLSSRAGRIEVIVVPAVNLTDYPTVNLTDYPAVGRTRWVRGAQSRRAPRVFVEIGQDAAGVTLPVANGGPEIAVPEFGSWTPDARVACPLPSRSADEGDEAQKRPDSAWVLKPAQAFQERISAELRNKVQ